MDLETLRDQLQTVTKFGGYRAFQETKDILRACGIMIEYVGGIQAHYAVLSNEELTDEVIYFLRGVGVIGSGSKFRYYKQLHADGKYLIRVEESENV